MRRRRRADRRDDTTVDRRLPEAGGPAGGTTGSYIDSFENMPGAQNQLFGWKPGDPEPDDA